MSKGLLNALMGEARGAVIGLLFSQPDRAEHFRDVVRKTGASVGSVQRELALLVRLGLVHRSASANLVEYRANRASPIFTELKGLADKTFGIEASVRTALEPFGRDIAFAALYGSVAAGTDDARSDIDVLVVGRVDFGDIVEALHPVAERLERAVNPIVFSRREFARRRREKESFLSAVLAKPVVPLIGSLDDA
jgi:predicted nucleotidyltransferase